MKKEFVIERQGKKMVLYAGLMDAATEAGLISLKSFLVQIPSPENGNTAICTATAIFEKEGARREFEEIGDASPSNVAAGMANCLPRMAATRAKARALRDALNVGVLAYEELGEDEPERAATGRQPARTLAAKCPHCGSTNSNHRLDCPNRQATE